MWSSISAIAPGSISGRSAPAALVRIRISHPSAFRVRGSTFTAAAGTPSYRCTRPWRQATSTPAKRPSSSRPAWPSMLGAGKPGRSTYSIAAVSSIAAAIPPSPEPRISPRRGAKFGTLARTTSTAALAWFGRPLACPGSSPSLSPLRPPLLPFLGPLPSVVLGLDPRTCFRRGAEPEGERQQLAERHGAAQPLRIAEVDPQIGSGELGEALPAAAARRAQALPGRDHQRLRDPPFAGGDHGRDRARLGAVAFRIAGVLDVGAAEDAAGSRAHGGADPEIRVRRMRILKCRARRIEQILHRRNLRHAV